MFRKRHDGMFQLAELTQLNDCFLPRSRRGGDRVFFCRIAGYSGAVADFLRQYYEAARRGGVIIDGRIPNPTPDNLAYYSEMMGADFRMDRDFLSQRLGKWLPRMTEGQREAVSAALYATLDDMRRQGKNENMLRNAYMKYMCWLYYKFERIVNVLGGEALPKILYAGDVSRYELQLLTVLSRAGADIVLLETGGDRAYLTVDPQSAASRLYQAPGLGPFPAGFGVKQLQADLEREVRRQRLYGAPPALSPCTNAWVEKPELNAALTPVQARGSDPRFFYNLFLCQHGVEDHLTYTNELFAFYQSLKNGGRRICVVNGDPPPPTPEEIAAVQRGHYAGAEQLAAGLAANIRYPANMELQRLMTKAFIDLVLEEGERCGGSVAKLTSRAVYLLCWLNRYQKDLFPDWKAPEVSVFIQFGGCASDAGALFLRLLARLPVDVLLLLPNLNEGSALRAPDLLEVHCSQSLAMDRFPVDQNQARVTTAAYQAERDLDQLMYQDTGLYRHQQYAKASTVILQTMYEEIPILWDQELKYRPSFSTAGDTVTLPVIRQKICGVKDGNVSQYWLDIKKLITPDTEAIRSVPWVQGTDPNPIKAHATQFLKNGRLLRNKIKSHSAYLYGILRPEVQEHLLDQLQLLLDQRLIRGTFENGTEYTVIATALNLPKDLLRRIQKFDFTKKNPKLIYINTTERMISLEDSILTAFLSLVGFDVLFFVPTGYQCIEQHFARPFAGETQIGDYLYDLTVPDFSTVQESGLHTIRKLFGRST